MVIVCSQLERLLNYKSNQILVATGLFRYTPFPEAMYAINGLSLQMQKYEETNFREKPEDAVKLNMADHVKKCPNCSEKYLIWLLNLYRIVLDTNKINGLRSSENILEALEMDFLVV